MRAELTFQERLNLKFILGNHRGWTPTDLRRVWTLMDALDLNDDEKSMVGHRVVIHNGTERDGWDEPPKQALGPRSYEFNERDVLRIKAALRGFGWAGNDRKWAGALLEKFVPEDLAE
jgi:hypothetical protein